MDRQTDGGAGCCVHLYLPNKQKGLGGPLHPTGGHAPPIPAVTTASPAP